MHASLSNRLNKINVSIKFATCWYKDLIDKFKKKTLRGGTNGLINTVVFTIFLCSFFDDYVD